MAAAVIVLCVAVSLLAKHLFPGPVIMVYGDSIVAGGGLQHRWADRLGALTDAKSGRALADDRLAGERIASTGPQIIWVAIGTNDYGKSKIGHREFQEAYGRLLDDIRATAPGATVFAQTPLLRRSEGLNKLGSTLADYRDAIWAECKGRPWARCVDGTKILALSDMPDGLHPGEDAQQRYAKFVANSLSDER